MKSPAFKGVCVGGPRDRMLVEGRERILYVPEMQSVFDRVEDMKAEAVPIVRHAYEWTELHFMPGEPLLGFWRYEKAPTGEAVAEVFRAYAEKRK